MGGAPCPEVERVITRYVSGRNPLPGNPQRTRIQTNPVNWILVASGFGAILMGIATLYVAFKGS